MTPCVRNPLCLTVLTTAAAMIVAACGGGGGSVGVSASGAQSATYVGPIGGFGSVIVNGMRFSSVGATLQDDDGQSVSLNQLKLGMTVQVVGDADDATQTGTAGQLQLIHGDRGMVTAIDTTAGTLTVLGQTIKTNAATAFLGVSNLAGLSLNQYVEVFGALQADGSILATLVQVKIPTAISVVGIVTTMGTNTFNIGSLTVNYSNPPTGGTLAVGSRVKVKAAVGSLTGNVLTASTVQVASASSVYGSNLAANTRIKLKGVATASVNGVLTVSGTSVNIASAVIRGGVSVTAGNFVEVKGIWDGSVLQATQVELEGYRESQIGGRNELYGSVSSLSGNTVTVNGVSVDLSTATFEHGSLAQVVVGSYVEIKGNLSGGVLTANRVELKSAYAANGVRYEQSGVVTDYVSSSNFKLNGMLVDASTAIFEYGNTLANGTYVEIKGALNGAGVFVASRVEIKAAGV